MELFKVMCVDDKKQVCEPRVQVGNTYRVAGIAKGKDIGSYHLDKHLDFYSLYEMPAGMWYCEDLFAPISEIDEMEFVRESIKQPA